MIVTNSKTVNILIINNDDSLIPILESEIKSFGFNISINTIRSFSELDDLASKKIYDAYILTNFGLQTSDLISYVDKMEKQDVLFIILFSKSDSKLFLKFSHYAFESRCFSYPLDTFLFRPGLERLVKGQKGYSSMTEIIDWTKELEKYKFLMDEIKKGNLIVGDDGKFYLNHSKLFEEFKEERATKIGRVKYSILLIGILIFTIIYIGKWFFLIYACLGFLLFIITQSLKLSKAKRWIGDLILSILIWPVMIILWDSFFKEIKFSKRETYLDKFNSIPGMKQISDYFEAMNKDGTTEDVIPNGIGRFGYDATNPIPTNNVFGSNAYLGRLRDKHDHPINYERLGTATAPNIKNLIDRYKLTDAKGNELGIIYISMYQKTISKKAPEGFTLK